MTTSRFEPPSTEENANLAQKLGGSLWKASDRWVIKFQVGDVASALELPIVTHRSKSARAMFSWSTSQPMILEIFREPSGFAFDRFFGAQDIEIGDREFDNRYVIRGKPVAEVKRFLTSQVRRAVDTVALTSAFSIRLSPQQLEVRFGGRPRNIREFTQFATAAVAVLRHVLNFNPDPDVSFVDEVQEQGKCLVCGGELGKEFVRCVLCHTPCHPRCWEYNGKCPIFGCSERRNRTDAAKRSKPKREGMRETIERLIFPLPRRKKR